MKIVPLISSGIAGPLDIIHLPRLWQKLLLESEGRLADGYPGCGNGFDQMVLDAIGIKKETAIAYINDNRPTYPQFEAWIQEQPGVKLDKGAVDKINGEIRGYIHDDKTRKNILEANGIPDDGYAPKDAINLNNLDDWKEFHTALVGVGNAADAGAGAAPAAAPAGEPASETAAATAGATN